MQKLTDDQLLEEIRGRISSNRSLRDEIHALTQKLEQVNEKLRETEALKSQFLSNIRNEINNPLSAIMGLSAQFFGQHCDPDVCKKTAHMIYAEAFDLDFQLQNIFIAAELEAGAVEPEYALVEIDALLDSCLEKLSGRIEDKGLVIQRTVPADLMFPTDAHKFELILLNLLANAIEFNAQQGQVDVHFIEGENALDVTIQDDGPGIAPADRQLIFDRFKQIDSGTTKSHRGHGLGLSICSALAEILDGTLAFDDEVEQGTRFVLTLPRPAAEVVTHSKEGNFFLFDSDEDVEAF